MESIQRVRTILSGQIPDHPAWGEVWIGSNVFEGSGFDDGLAGQIALRHYMGMDLLWLSVGRTAKYHNQGYRIFLPEDLARAGESCRLFIGGVVEGPWQRLADEMGLMNLITNLAGDRDAVASALKQKGEEILALIEDCLAQGIDGLIIADDLAGHNGPLISPRQIDEMLGPFYGRAARIVHDANVLALFHSCGDTGKLLDIIAKAGFQGLAAVQTALIGLACMTKHFKSRPVLLGGLDFDESAESSRNVSFMKLINPWVLNCRLILCSSSGVYSWKKAKELMELYNSWPNCQP
jgi:hypothetical protein